MAIAQEQERRVPNRVFDSIRRFLEPKNRGINRLRREITRSYQRILPSTVTIYTAQPVYDMLEGRNGAQIGVGAGFVVESNRKNALVATNAHVIEGALHGGGVMVTTSGVEHKARREVAKQELPVEDIWISPTHDVAFVKVDLTKFSGLALPPIKMRDDNPLLAGTPVLTVGAPHALEDTLSAQNYVAHDYAAEQIAPGGRRDRYIQLGGSIYSGNSGGVTVDHSFRRPRAVGMVTLGIEGDPTKGFMLPIKVVKDELQKYKKGVPSAHLGYYSQAA